MELDNAAPTSAASRYCPDSPRGIGASPAKKQKQMDRSYAAVVRASFKPADPSSAEESQASDASSTSSSSSSSTSTSPITMTASNFPQLVRPAPSQDVRRSLDLDKDSTASYKKQRTAASTKDTGKASGQRRPKKANEDYPDVHPFLRQLNEALEVEVKYRGAVQPSSSSSPPPVVHSNNSNSNNATATITSGMRDGSVHVLRCLKVLYELPSDIFFNAVSSIDRFLAKMKAQPKHLSCIAVSAFHLACKQYRQLQLEKKSLVAPAGGPHLLLAGLVSIPEPADLVSISQSRCSPSDLLRMQNILQSKLELNPGAGPESPITALTFLRLMYSVSKAAAFQLGLDDLFPDDEVKEGGRQPGGDPLQPSSVFELPEALVHQLEILACDSMTLKYRPCEVALALLTTEFQRKSASKEFYAGALMGFISELQKYCNINPDSFLGCLNVVVAQLEKYNGECTVAHRQRLVWKLSNRTLRHLRPTDKLRSTLPTIKEFTKAASGVSVPQLSCFAPAGSIDQDFGSEDRVCQDENSYDGFEEDEDDEVCGKVEYEADVMDVDAASPVAEEDWDAVVHRHGPAEE